MSPTSYQTAPPRSSIIVNAFVIVKPRSMPAPLCAERYRWTVVEKDLRGAEVPETRATIAHVAVISLLEWQEQDRQARMKFQRKRVVKATEKKPQTFIYNCAPFIISIC